MDEVLDPHQFGVALAERVIDTYGLEIANEQVDDAVAFVTPVILERVREMWHQAATVGKFGSLLAQAIEARTNYRVLGSFEK